jgi:hypothetical protein
LSLGLLELPNRGLNRPLTLSHQPFDYFDGKAKTTATCFGSVPNCPFPLQGHHGQCHPSRPYHLSYIRLHLTLSRIIDRSTVHFRSSTREFTDHGQSRRDNRRSSAGVHLWRRRYNLFLRRDDASQQFARIGTGFLGDSSLHTPAVSGGLSDNRGPIEPKGSTET